MNPDMRRTTLLRSLTAAIALAALANLAHADPARPRPGNIVTAQGIVPPEPVPDQDADDPGKATMLLRIERLETDLRRANGMIEELQNQNQRLADELKRFREDVEFRLSGASPPAVASNAPSPAPSAPVRKSDAFDPNAAPDAPGAPMPLGSTPPSAPLDIAPKVADLAPPKPADSGPTVIGSGLDFADGPRGQFNAAVDAYKSGQFPAAEDQFKAFLAANAGHRLAPDAVFYLGETYLQRARPREAAEQFLRLSTDYARSPRAPEGMLRLGQSLAMLGNAEQACATFAEVGRRFPSASPNVRKSVEREMQKDRC